METSVKYAFTMLSHLVNKMLNQSSSTSKQFAYAQSFATWPKSLHVWHSARGHILWLCPFGSSSPLHKVHTCSGHKWLVGNL